MQSYLTAEISASAVAANLTMLRRAISPSTRMCPAVKADCYGHGLELLLDTIAQHADCLAVATPEEAVKVRELGYRRPVLAFFCPCAHTSGPARQEALEELIARQITLTVVSPAEVAAVAEAAKRIGAKAQIHIKIDSGMGRSGIPFEAAPALASLIRSSAGVELTGLYTHLATADEADKAYALRQLENFRQAAAACGRREGLTLHAANSAGTIDLPQSHLDMVRPGIAVYGYQPSDAMHNRLPLRPALRLWGPLMQIKEVPAGTGVGYGLTCRLDRPSRLGLAPVGYADGYFRNLSNKATMRIRGKDVPVRGRVSMDQTIIDLTDVPDARVGDVVEIISSDPAAPHSVENLARLAGTIPHEITCRLGRRVKRVLV